MDIFQLGYLQISLISFIKGNSSANLITSRAVDGEHKVISSLVCIYGYEKINTIRLL
jgi:hypothetical protein